MHDHENHIFHSSGYEYKGIGTSCSIIIHSKTSERGDKTFIGESSGW
jgi:hypothetical protein